MCGGAADKEQRVKVHTPCQRAWQVKYWGWWLRKWKEGSTGWASRRGSVIWWFEMVFWREGGFSSTLQGAAGWWGGRRKLGCMLSERLDEEDIMEGLQRTSRSQRNRGTEVSSPGHTCGICLGPQTWITHRIYSPDPGGLEGETQRH